MESDTENTEETDPPTTTDTTWTTGNLDELGFDMVLSNQEVLISAPTSGIIYGVQGDHLRVAQESPLLLAERAREGFASKLASLGDSWCSLTRSTRAIVDNRAVALDTRLYRDITSANMSWYGLSENAIIKDGQPIKDFADRRISDIAVCDSTIGVVFTFASEDSTFSQLWIYDQDTQEESWPSVPTGIFRSIDCLSRSDSTVIWAIGGDDKVVVLQNNDAQTLTMDNTSSVSTGFGTDIDMLEHNDHLYILVGAALFAENTGWVGLFSLDTPATPLHTWEGTAPQQYFGLSVLFALDNTVFISAPQQNPSTVYRYNIERYLQ